jgi:benzodiazapine receptor
MELSTAAALLVFVGLNLLAALSGAYFRPGAWYRTLAKPAWQPPDRLFGPVWAVLYLANAVAGWLVWQRAGLGTAMLVYLVSLGLNAGWSAIFFGLRRIDGALLWIVLLWLSILTQILLFWPISKFAAVLLLPYLAWVSFAAALNAVLWRLNPSSVGGR